LYKAHCTNDKPKSTGHLFTTPFELDKFSNQSYKLSLRNYHYSSTVSSRISIICLPDVDGIPIAHLAASKERLLISREQNIS
jgi:hypothetical protein